MAEVRAAGDHLGPFELVARLGRGATGDVWEAVLHGPAGFRKPVALKCLRADRMADPKVVATLQHEARLGAALQHPNIVGTLGLSEHGGTWVVALELVRGASLSQLLKAHGPLSARAVLDVGVQAASGLAHAHEAGLVHRDVKPANLLLDRTGLVKVADLGISVLAGQVGTGAGTLAYMAPEQATGSTDPRADQFSLGVVLFVLATGHRPFGTGHRALAAVQRVEATLKQPHFLAPVAAAVPGLEDVVRRCLRAEPADRYPDARVLAEAIAALRSQQSTAGESLLTTLARARPGLSVSPTSASADTPTLVLPSGNVPPARDRFVGRQDLLRPLSDRVAQGSRLLVLCALGGMGKTRLALEVARTVQAEMPGGAWAFDLTEARTVEGVCAVVARILGVRLDATDPVGQLGRALAARGRALVLLDNLEQCVEALPQTLGRWMDTAVDATFLCTSRTPLGLTGEVLVDVGPLATTDASALFEARATRPLTDDERGKVPELMDALQGMPLAIELAAARVRLLGVDRILERLGLEMLSGGRRDLPERHRSLSASLDWSAALLGEAALTGLTQLSVFDGAFALESAEAVLDVADVLGVLDELVHACLVRVDPDTGRFSLLVVVRQYAAGRLSDPDRAKAERRHGRFFAQLGTDEALEALERPGGVGRWHRLASELADLIAACDRAVAREDGSTAVATLKAAFQVLQLQGPHALAVRLADAVCAMPLTDRRRAAALAVGGITAEQDGDLVLARERLEAALSLLRAAGADRQAAPVLGSLGGLLLRSGQVAEAKATLQEGLDLARRTGARQREGAMHGNLGWLAQYEGRIDDALQHYDTGLALLREVGARRSEAFLLLYLGNLHGRRGRAAEGRRWLQEALTAYRQLRDVRCAASAIGELALLDQRQGRIDEAEAGYERALQLYRQIGERRFESGTLSNLATLEHESGRFERALAHHQEALVVLGETSDLEAVAASTGDLGNVLVDLGRLDDAMDHFERALKGHRACGSVRGEAIVLGNIGALHRIRGAREPAQAALRRAVEMLGDIQVVDVQAAFLGELARIDLDRGDLAEAETTTNRAVTLGRTVDAPAVLATLLATRAEVALRQGELDAARSALDEAEAHAPSGHRETQAEIVRVRGLLTGR